MKADTLQFPMAVQGQCKVQKRRPIPVKCRQRNRFIPAFLIGDGTVYPEPDLS